MFSMIKNIVGIKGLNWDILKVISDILWQKICILEVVVVVTGMMIIIIITTIILISLFDCVIAFRVLFSAEEKITETWITYAFLIQKSNFIWTIISATDDGNWLPKNQTISAHTVYFFSPLVYFLLYSSNTFVLCQTWFGIYLATKFLSCKLIMVCHIKISALLILL